MKFIHTGDIHLDSKSNHKAVKTTFSRMADYAAENSVRAILIAGDLFDGDKPAENILAFVRSVIASHTGVDFIYLPGNHDRKLSEVFNMPNFFTFGDSWSSYSYDNVLISGIVLDTDNSEEYYSTLDLPFDKVNVVMLHGQVGESVNIAKIVNHNIDYLALGHVHYHSDGVIDERGNYAYCGCPEPRGFDDCGEEKGFVLLDVAESGKVTSSFVDFSERKYHEITVDVSDCETLNDIVQKCTDNAAFPSKDAVNLILTGEVTADCVDADNVIASAFEGRFFGCRVKNQTSVKINPADFDGDTTLRGAFVRTIFEDNTLDDETRRAVLACGLAAISGGDF